MRRSFSSTPKRTFYSLFYIAPSICVKRKTASLGQGYMQLRNRARFYVYFALYSFRALSAHSDVVEAGAVHGNSKRMRQSIYHCFVTQMPLFQKAIICRRLHVIATIAANKTKYMAKPSKWVWISTNVSDFREIQNRLVKLTSWWSSSYWSFQHVSHARVPQLYVHRARNKCVIILLSSIKCDFFSLRFELRNCLIGKREARSGNHEIAIKQTFSSSLICLLYCASRNRVL